VLVVVVVLQLELLAFRGSKGIHSPKVFRGTNLSKGLYYLSALTSPATILASFSYSSSSS
jgi:hypothetical protein